MNANEKAEVFFIIVKKIGKWFLFALLILILIFLCLYSYDKITNYLENLPKVITELKGIKVGEKYSDFVFKNPGFKAKKINFKTINELHYENIERRLSVSVNNSKIEDINYICDSESDYTNINGIACNDLGDKIVEKFTNEVKIQCLLDKDNLLFPDLRVYDVVKYGVRYELLNNNVVSYKVSSPESLSKYTGINWGQCE